jgi:hypothetical protein
MNDTRATNVVSCPDYMTDPDVWVLRVPKDKEVPQTVVVHGDINERTKKVFEYLEREKV